MKRAGLLGCLLLAACHGSRGTAITPLAATVSPVAVIVEPSVTVASSSDPTTLVMQWDVVLRTAGSGGRVAFINSTVRDAVSGAAVWPSPYANFGPAEIAAAGGTLLPAGGSLRVTQHLTGRLLSGQRSATVTVAVQVVSDENEVWTETAETPLPVE